MPRRCITRPRARNHTTMKTRILFTILSLCTAVCLTSCIASVDTGTSSGNVGTTVTVYELNVNGEAWSFYGSKISLTDNAQKNPETYEYDYTLTLRAADASNMINAESKILTFNFDAENIEELKDTNFSDCENFHLLYRGKMESKAQTYTYQGGVMTITAIDKGVATIVFNSLKMKTTSTADISSPLPDLQSKEITLSGEIKCTLPK